MKKIIYALTISSMLFACKSKTTENANADSTAVTETTPEQTAQEAITPQPENAPKSYKAVFSPDSATLGKKSEAKIKIKEGSGVELSDPEGKTTGILLTLKFDVTNKNAISDGNSVYMNTSLFRLQLDNGSSVSPKDYNTTSASPESTTNDATAIFEVPPGAKPVKLVLFYDDTRATVGLTY